MANTVLKNILQNGSKSLIMHVYMESDGSGELENYVLLDPEDEYLQDMGSKNPRPVIRQVWSSLGWFDVLLSFDDLVPSPSWLIQRDGPGYHDLRFFGGLKEKYPVIGDDGNRIDSQDPASSQRTGRLLISTTDFAPAGSQGTLVLEIWKGEA